MPVRILEGPDEPAGGAPTTAGRVRVLEPFQDAGPKKTSESLGFMEELSNVLGKVPSTPLDLIPGLDARPQREAARQGTQHYFDEREQHEKPGLVGQIAGQIAGTAPLMAVGGNPIAVGAAQGALTSHAKDAMGVALDAATGAALNKVGGAVIGKIADAAAPVIDPAVQLLKKAGVRLTPGQVQGGKALVREDKRMSLPGVGDEIAKDRATSIADFNRGGVNRALLPIGVKLPDSIATGHDAIAFMQDAVSNAYNKIAPNLKLQPDARVAVGLRNAQNIVGQLPDVQRDVFNRIVSGKMDFGQAGEMSGRRLAVAIRDIRQSAAGYSKSASEAERQLGQALHAIDDGLQSALGAQNPGYADALKKTNLAYRGTRIMSDAARGADEGIASTGQVKNAVRANDGTKNQRATAAGRALMQDYASAGRKVLPSKTPDSGTAGRVNADKLIPQIKGAVDSARYKAEKLYTDAMLADRPEWVTKAGGILHDLGPQARLVTSGIFAGLLPRD